jgi:hypothetical protein
VGRGDGRAGGRGPPARMRVTVRSSLDSWRRANPGRGMTFACLACRYVGVLGQDGCARVGLERVPYNHPAYGASLKGACYSLRIFSEMHNTNAITIQGTLGTPRATVSTG